MAVYHKFLDPRLTVFEKLDSLALFVAKNVNRHEYRFTNTTPAAEQVACFAGYVGEGTDRSGFKDPREICRHD